MLKPHFSCIILNFLLIVKKNSCRATTTNCVNVKLSCCRSIDAVHGEKNQITERKKIVNVFSCSCYWNWMIFMLTHRKILSTSRFTKVVCDVQLISIQLNWAKLMPTSSSFFHSGKLLGKKMYCCCRCYCWCWCCTPAITINAIKVKSCIFYNTLYDKLVFVVMTWSMLFFCSFCWLFFFFVFAIFQKNIYSIMIFDHIFCHTSVDCVRVEFNVVIKFKRTKCAVPFIFICWHCYSVKVLKPKKKRNGSTESKRKCDANESLHSEDFRSQTTY